MQRLEKGFERLGTGVAELIRRRVKCGSVCVPKGNTQTLGRIDRSLGDISVILCNMRDCFLP